MKRAKLHHHEVKVARPKTKASIARKMESSPAGLIFDLNRATLLFSTRRGYGALVNALLAEGWRTVKQKNEFNIKDFIVRPPCLLMQLEVMLTGAMLEEMKDVLEEGCTTWIVELQVPPPPSLPTHQISFINLRYSSFSLLFIITSTKMI